MAPYLQARPARLTIGAACIELTAPLRVAGTPAGATDGCWRGAVPYGLPTPSHGKQMPPHPPAGLTSVGVCLGVRVAVGFSALVGVGASSAWRCASASAWAAATKSWWAWPAQPRLAGKHAVDSSTRSHLGSRALVFQVIFLDHVRVIGVEYCHRLRVLHASWLAHVLSLHADYCIAQVPSTSIHFQG